DEADPSKLPMYIKLVESRELPECRIILTSRHEVGMKFRRFCDTLWEIVGFTYLDARSFIFKHFKNNKPMADKLLTKLYGSDFLGDRPEELVECFWPRSIDHLRELTSNPLNTALLCVLWEDFEGDLPTSRTQLYIEIVLCVLRRYEKKNGLASNNEDLIKVYKKELICLGLMALISLRKGELYIEESESGSNSTALTKFGFLSVQAAGSRRKTCLRYGFLHKSFQEFFAGFYLATKILSEEIDLDTEVTDKRYLTELKQVFLFMSGIVTSQCEETAVCLVKSITKHINCGGRSTLFNKLEVTAKNVRFAFDCITECITCKENLQSRLAHTFGSHLDLETLTLEISDSEACFLSDALTVNATLTDLNLSRNGIGHPGAGSLSKALTVNTTLTHLDLSGNRIGDFGADSLSNALVVNTTLANLNLICNRIGNSGAGSLSDALTVNTTLTHLVLSRNTIGDSGAGSLSKALTVNTALAHLDLSENRIGDSGACSLAKALTVNTTLAYLDLSRNSIGHSGAGFLSKALTVNAALAYLDLSGNTICDSGAGSLSSALTVNTTITYLNLRGNGIGYSGAGSLSKALVVNTTLTHLDLSGNMIGDSGTGSLSRALTVNKRTTITYLNLRGNKIGHSGAGFLSKALAVNTTVTDLNLSANGIGDSGAGFLSRALTVNTTVTDLDLSENWIGASGAGFLSKALTVNITLSHLDLSLNRIGPTCRASLSDAQTVNSTCSVQLEPQFL
ncbi:hypothetical protein ACROYT_G012402, partial [Oculina patagonica]